MSRDKLRRRFVDDVLGEIKRVALAQIETGGPASVSVNAIGRELGVSGPALYRYVGGREELITALMIDAYDDLYAVTAAAVATRRTPQTRLSAFVAAYRHWAREHPHRYGLLFSTPLAGYDANAEASLPSAQRLMNVLLDALQRPTRSSAGRDALGVGGWLRRNDLPAALAPVAADALVVWSRLHGLVALELAGAYASMGLAADVLYDREFDLVRLGG